MITVVNFANKEFRSKQKWNSFTAKVFGKVDRVISYSPESIDNEYITANTPVLKYNKGYGNYFWKPYIILKAYRQIKENDYLFYADSGSVFLKSIYPLINFMNENNQNILAFRLPLIEKQWTKRDAFILMNCESEECINTPQIMGTFILLKRCIASEKFLLEFQHYCSDRRILSDDENVMGKDNYKEFIEHRHDQSVLSLLCKKHNILTIGDISDYGLFPQKYIHRPDYLYEKESLYSKNNAFAGTLLCNRKVHPLIYFIKFVLKVVLYRLKPTLKY